MNLKNEIKRSQHTYFIVIFFLFVNGYRNQGSRVIRTMHHMYGDI